MTGPDPSTPDTLQGLFLVITQTTDTTDEKTVMVERGHFVGKNFQFKEKCRGGRKKLNKNRSVRSSHLCNPLTFCLAFLFSMLQNLKGATFQKSSNRLSFLPPFTNMPKRPSQAALLGNGSALRQVSKIRADLLLLWETHLPMVTLAQDLHSRTDALGESIHSQVLGLGPPGKDKTKLVRIGVGECYRGGEKTREMPLKHLTGRQGNPALEQLLETSSALSKGRTQL